MMVSYEEWRTLDIFHPKDTDYQDWTTEEWYTYYSYKNHYAELSRPTRVLEIGVRLGYSAYSFLLAPSVKEYVGLDIQEPLDGGMPFETFSWVKDKVFSKFPAVRASLHKCDTQSGFPSGLGTFDFIHVDGDHSYTGALNDMNSCWELLNRNGLMVVDDIHFIPKVKNAVKDWCAENNVCVIEGFSKRGDALLWKTKEE